jgi:hypothetical protein
MRGIFISYRRDDTAGYAGRLFDFLRERLGDDRVFMDVTDIAPGSDFVQTLARGLQESEAVLVFIGPRWASATTIEGRLRLWEPEDFVRKEVTTALVSGRRVVPVLVQGASMPREEQVPPELQGLLTRQGVILSDTRWQRDCEDLLHDLLPPGKPVAPLAAVAALPPASASASASASAPRRCAQWKGLVALGIVVAALGGGIVAERAGLVPFALPWSQRAVPDVVGLARAEAERSLQEAGFQLAEPALAREAREPRGTVVGQRPGGGTTLASGSTVALTISARPVETLVEVPNVTQHSLEEARGALARRGLKLGRVESRSAAAKAGLVLEQSVQPMARVAAGSAVNLVVAAAGPAPTPPPNPAPKTSSGPGQPVPGAPGWDTRATEPVRVTVESLCGKRVLLAYQRCVDRACANAVHADDPLCRQAPPVASGGN